MKYRDQFYLLRDLIKGTGLARIWVYQHNQFFGEDCEAYAVVENVHIPEIRIALKDEKEKTYRSAIATLLHEFGHSLDFERYGKTKRYKISNAFDADFDMVNGNCDYNILKKYPRELKVAVVKTEFMAWQFAKYLARLWEIDIDPEWIEIEQTAHLQHMLIKMKLQRRLQKRYYEKFRDIVQDSGVRMTGEDVRCLRLLLNFETYEHLLRKK